MDAIRGIPPTEFSDLRLEALDEPLLKELAISQVATLHMMDRMDAFGSFSFPERVRLYHHILAYWQSVLNETSATVVVFSQAPHMIYDYVLYCLCQQMGIHTIMFEFTKVGSLLFPTTSIEGETEVMQVYGRLLTDYEPGSAHISESSQNHLNAMSGSYEEIPLEVHPFYSLGGEFDPRFTRKTKLAVSIPSGIFKKTLRLLRKPASFAYQSWRKPAPTNYLKQWGKKIEDSWISGREYHHYRSRSSRKMRQLKGLYQHMAEKPDLTKQYIYVPLAYQPERTTSPLGSVFVYQLAMMQMLSQCLPDEWHLYVREHPTQFLENQAFRAQAGRSSDFYDDLMALPNVSLVDLSVPSFDLTDNSMAVASVVSTAGWEAVVRGKPAMIFGYPWFRGCEGVFQTGTKENCLDTMGKISGGYRVDRGKVELYIQALEEVGATGYVDSTLAELSGISPEENSEVISWLLKKSATTLIEPSRIKI
jgi:hypothetical protein